MPWQRLCGTRHGEGGQEVFGFPPTAARFVRWSAENPERNPGPDIVQINLYGLDDAVRVLEAGRIEALGRAPVMLPVGESITADFGYVRSPSGLRVDWREAYDIDFSSRSPKTANISPMGRIANGKGLYDNYYWPSIAGRFVRLTLHAASSPEGAIVKTRSNSGSSARTGCLSENWSGRPAPGAANSILNRCSAGRSIGPCWPKRRAERSALRRYGNLEPQQGGARSPPRFAWRATCTARLDARRSAAPSSAGRCRCQPSLGPLKAGSPGERACSRRPGFGGIPGP